MKHLKPNRENEYKFENGKRDNRISSNSIIIKKEEIIRKNSCVEKKLSESKTLPKIHELKVTKMKRNNLQNDRPEKETSATRSLQTIDMVNVNYERYF